MIYLRFVKPPATVSSPGMTHETIFSAHFMKNSSSGLMYMYSTSSATSSSSSASSGFSSSTLFFFFRRYFFFFGAFAFFFGPPPVAYASVTYMYRVNLNESFSSFVGSSSTAQFSSLNKASCIGGSSCSGRFTNRAVMTTPSGPFSSSKNDSTSSPSSFDASPALFTAAFRSAFSTVFPCVAKLRHVISPTMSPSSPMRTVVPTRVCAEMASEIS
mmetsp:Transcript_28547/g.71649  ORF Transcript_28547/g.71649 Transcript_28547/m.71649 type:complete len:215 (-) Transcript_28547:346-990(-)